MPVKRPQTGVPVRGECPAGHVTETTSDPGRITWEGPCAHPGCELRVKKARRVPRDRLPDKPDGPETPAPAPAGDYVVKEVHGDAPYGSAPADRLDGAGDEPDEHHELPAQHIELDPAPEPREPVRREPVVTPAAPTQRPRRPGLRERLAAGRARSAGRWADSTDLPGGAG